ncbi:MAG: hypothetical protein ACH350_05835 [Parachlamydiaceae bacterium]
MAKVNFSKVEESFEKALQRLSIENLSEFAAIANAIEDPQKAMSSKTIDEIIIRFQKELEKIKREDPILFSKLNLSPENEERFSRTAADYTQEDWLRLKELKLQIDELKKELCGKEKIAIECDAHIEKERKRHINKRFNIRDNWLPLH